jgi:hypothetical protein
MFSVKSPDKPMQIVHLICREKRSRAWNGLPDAVKCDVMTSRQVHVVTARVGV